ncbi:hypothetical protein KR093_004058 [Drosophila rubida]|uniref:CHK kinase-like domain-containing protein n=1 Tax=Drosophila rubida TaxID=30044 RepID=A0AAD4K6X2_9MUSC|nr:hypothetical protein KR093_004058 [Drosophila rubida]
MLLTLAECHSIVKNMCESSASDDLRILKYDLERDISAIGYLGDYYALTLTYSYAGDENTKETKLFVKALPQQSDEAEKEAIFRKEAWLYDNLLPKMQTYSKLKWSANCYYSRPDLCVFENLKLCGYRNSPSTLLGQQQLLQVLRTLAAFHAASLIYEQQQAVDIGAAFGGHLLEITVAANIAWFTTGLAAIIAVIKSLPRYQTSDCVKFIDSQLTKILQGVYQQVAPSTKYRNVLCHRDLWAGNMFFPSNPKDALILVDFQTCRYTPPAIDLCLSLYLNLTHDQRVCSEGKCMDFYYDWLQKDLQDFGLQAAELIPKTELLQSYEEFRLFAVVYNAAAATVIKVPKEFVTNDFKFVDRSKTILQHMKDNAEFRCAMEKCCEQVMEVAMLRS